jgi:lanosterol synthase
MALQDAAGRWEGEVVWCAVITAQVVLAYAIMGRVIGLERRRLILRHFARTRRPDGGWGLHPASHSYLFVTILVYVASRLLGEAADSRKVLARCQAGGASGCRCWAYTIASG